MIRQENNRPINPTVKISIKDAKVKNTFGPSEIVSEM